MSVDEFVDTDFKQDTVVISFGHGDLWKNALPFITESKEYHLSEMLIGRCKSFFNEQRRSYLVSEMDKLESIIKAYQKEGKNVVVLDTASPSKKNGGAPPPDYEGLARICKETGAAIVKASTQGAEYFSPENLGEDVLSVVSPNNSFGIVSIMDFFKDYASKHEGELIDCIVDMTESHQKTKKDPSGTGVGFFHNKKTGEDGPFTKLGLDVVKYEDSPYKDKGEFATFMNSVRDVDEQRKLGITDEYLSGHGWHKMLIMAKEGESENLHNLYKALDEFMSQTTVFNDGFNMYNSYEAARKANPEILFDHDQFNTKLKERGITKSDLEKMDEFYIVSKSGDVAFTFRYIEGKMLDVSTQVNGRAEYGRGIAKCLSFAAKGMKDDMKGHYGVIDVINSQKQNK